MFFAVTKGHQADIGNTIPSTYVPAAKDMFDEGAIVGHVSKFKKTIKMLQILLKLL